MKNIKALKPVIRTTFPNGMYVIAVEWDDIIGVNAMLIDDGTAKRLPAYEESAERLVNRLPAIRKIGLGQSAGRHVNISDAPDTLMIVLSSGERIINDAYIGDDSSAA